MRPAYRYLSILPMICLAFAASACNSETRPVETATPLPHEQVTHPEGATLEAPRPQQWTVRYAQKCPSTTQEKCSGAHGFSVSSDGHYEVGPGPGGELITGQVAAADLEAVKTAVPHAESACARTANAPTTEHVYFSIGAAVSESCDEALLTAARALTSKYYPSVFPSPCIDAALTLEKSYAELIRCEKDSDCSYIDDSYMPIDAQSSSAVPLDDCTFVKPLVVANAFETVARQLQLVMKREIVRRVCGDDIARPSCTHPTSLNPTDAPPRCISGACRAHN